MLKLIKTDMDMNVINTTKEDPSKILTLPFDIMIKFICCVGKVDKPLFQTLVETAGEQYGIDFIAYSVSKQLDLYAKK
jgi:hypothetical protein